MATDDAEDPCTTEVHEGCRDPPAMVREKSVKAAIDAKPKGCAHHAAHKDEEPRANSGHKERLAASAYTGGVTDAVSKAGARKSPWRLVVWVLLTFGVAALVVIGALVWPFLFPAPRGQSGQGVVEGYPTSVSATGDDGRTRTLSVFAEDGSPVSLAELRPGQRLVVEGSGYDAGQGIYVAICRIPDAIDVKPGPCLGGVPSTEEQADRTADVIEWAPSNWINNEWAWRLFGARSFDDPDQGTFRAYIDVALPGDEFVDCRVEACGLYTRNDHTALDNRMQDVYLPVAFVD